MTICESETIIEFIKLTARQAGELISSFDRSELSTSKKGPRDLVTKADIAAEKLITNAIKTTFPSHSILAEEGYNSLPTTVPEYLWVVDPIDGTMNYAHHLRHSAVSIALLNNGIVCFGVVYNPFTDEMYHAVKGKGAYCNKTPIAASSCNQLEDALVATGLPTARPEEVVSVLVERFGRVVNSCRDIRRFGAASLDCCLVASGKIDAYYECVNPWDIAAARLIVTEAGGKVGHTAHSKSIKSPIAELRSDNFLVAAPGIFNQLQKLLQVTA